MRTTHYEGEIGWPIMGIIGAGLLLLSAGLFFGIASDRTVRVVLTADRIGGRGFGITGWWEHERGIPDIIYLGGTRWGLVMLSSSEPPLAIPTGLFTRRDVRTIIETVLMRNPQVVLDKRLSGLLPTS